MIIGIYFDGTCVKHAFPAIGNDIGAIPILKELVDNGHKLILYTMRSDVDDPKSSGYDIHPEGGKYLYGCGELVQEKRYTSLWY